MNALNENLILASTGCNDPVIFDIAESVPGGQCISSNVPALSPGAPQRVSTLRRFGAGFREVPGRRRRVHLEVHAQGVRLQRARQHADHLPDRVAQFENSRLCYAPASVPNTHGFTAYVIMSSVAARFFTGQGQRHRSNARYRWWFRISHRPRRALQRDHPFAISAVEARPFGLDSTGAMTVALLPVPCFGGESCRSRQGGGGPDDCTSTCPDSPDQQVRARYFAEACMQHRRRRSVRRLERTFAQQAADSGAGLYLSIPAPARTTTTIRNASRHGICSTLP